MKLLILSDLHLEFGTFLVPKVDYDAVILAGDISVPGSKAMRWARQAENFGESVPIVFVPGNHEFYQGVLQTTLKEMALTARSCDVHLLAPGEAVIAGVRFWGCTLWTDFELPIQTETGLLVDTERAMKAAKVHLDDYSSIRWAEAQESSDSPAVATKPKKRRLVPEDTRALHQSDRAWLAQKMAEPFDGPTVVVTHHAPHRGSLAPPYQSDWLSGAFVSERPSAFFEVPSLWVHCRHFNAYEMKPLIPSDLHARSEKEQSKPKLMFFGDPHGDFDPVIAAVERFRPEAIVLLGDIQARQPLQIELQSILPLTEVHWIHGNHDTDGDLDYQNLFESDLADRSLHCRIVSVAGYLVAGLGGIFRSKIWDPRRPIEEAAFTSSDAMRRTMKSHERWRDGISRKHRSSIFPDEYQRLLRSGPADILVTHEAPSAHPNGWHAIDQLAETLGVQLVVHGHHHRCIDYVSEGLMTTAAPFRAFGVDMGSHLAWPRSPQEEAGLESLLQDLLKLATQVFGAAAEAWFNKPHELLDGQTPTAVAAEGGADRVRSILIATQHGGVV